MTLVRERYADFGPTLAAEKLAERDGLGVSRETLRSWMTEAGIWLSRKQRLVRQLGRLEMRRSRLLTHWSKPTLAARMTTFGLAETMSSRHVLYDHHVAERIASPRKHPEPVGASSSAPSLPLQPGLTGPVGGLPQRKWTCRVWAFLNG